MRIVIDAYQMRTAITGTDRQARNILRELQAMDQTNTYVVIVNADIPFVAEAVTAKNFTLHPIRLHKRASWIFLGLPLLLLRLRADVFFSFHNLTAPVLPVCRSVVSALDLIPFIYQKRYYRGWKSYWFRRVIVLGYMRIAIRTGRAFWANSQFTKDDLVKRFGVPAERVKVGYMEVEPYFAEQPTPDESRALRDKYQLGEHFIYAIGGSEPRKNNRLVIAAHQKLPAELRAQFPLVIGGGAWQGEKLEVNDPYVRVIGFVEDHDHAHMFHLASMFVWASEYEGFGLPILEAMKAGAPVIASDATCHPEVAGQAAVLVPTGDAAALTTAMEQLATNPDERQKLSEAGRQRAAQFSWRDATAAIFDLLTKP